MNYLLNPFIWRKNFITVLEFDHFDALKGIVTGTSNVALRYEKDLQQTSDKSETYKILMLIETLIYR